MTEPFVAQLRTRGDTIELASPSGPAITVRVQMPEVWDAVRVHASPDERAITVKRRALEAQILALRAQFENEADEIQKEIAFEKTREQVLEAEKVQMSRMRLGNGAAKGKRERNGKGT